MSSFCMNFESVTSFTTMTVIVEYSYPIKIKTKFQLPQTDKQIHSHCHMQQIRLLIWRRTIWLAYHCFALQKRWNETMCVCVCEKKPVCSRWSYSLSVWVEQNENDHSLWYTDTKQRAVKVMYLYKNIHVGLLSEKFKANTFPLF